MGRADIKMANKLSVEKEKVLWKDRRRRLGLPLSFTRYEVDESRLIIRKGFFKTETDEIMIYRIMDISLVRTLGQKILGVGTITLISTDKSLPKLTLKNIKRSNEVMSFISKLIEKQRFEKGITGREFLSGSFMDSEINI